MTTLNVNIDVNVKIKVKWSPTMSKFNVNATAIEVPILSVRAALYCTSGSDFPVENEYGLGNDSA